MVFRINNFSFFVRIIFSLFYLIGPGLGFCLSFFRKISCFSLFGKWIWTMLFFKDDKNISQFIVSFMLKCNVIWDFQQNFKGMNVFFLPSFNLFTSVMIQMVFYYYAKPKCNDKNMIVFSKNIIFYVWILIIVGIKWFT